MTKQQLKTITTEVTVDEIIEGAYTPLDLSIIPDNMGINLASVYSIEYVQVEGSEQLVSVKINFIPDLSGNKFERLFTALAEEIQDNPSGYVRKLSRKDIKAYDEGDDEFGDIVNWAERQLESASNVEELLGGETREDWFEAEYNILLELSELYKK